MQAENCNDQIPAKAYEYIRCRKPVLALTAQNGETARLIQDAGAGEVIPLDSCELIAQAIDKMRQKFYLDNYCLPIDVDKYSRRNGAILLIDLLTRLIKT
jgi:hypothetical protein